jgi:hypothetical protein
VWLGYSTAPFMQQSSTSTLLFLLWDLNFDGKFMDGFFICLQRIVPNLVEISTVTREMEMHIWALDYLTLTRWCREKKLQCQGNNVNFNYKF